jgi:hypothetical protein
MAYFFLTSGITEHNWFLLLTLDSDVPPPPHRETKWVLDFASEPFQSHGDVIYAY